jgi:glycosyltransferase involved in cell wall biosynthesis
MHILYLNQMAGPMFRELAEDLSDVLGPGTLLTGHPDTLAARRTPRLSIISAPPYDRTTPWTRLASWIRYALRAGLRALATPAPAFALIVSNPPFIGIVGLALRALRGGRYAVLVYDVYPDIAENFGKIRRDGLVARTWRRLNRLVLEHADVVFTLGTDMAAALRRQFEPRRTRAREIVIVPPWADVHAVAPVDPSANPFRRACALPDQLLVMYSGNFGLTHDLETIVEAARKLRDRPDIRFVFVGSGAKLPLIQRFVGSPDGARARLLPPVPESELRFSMSAADVAVSTLETPAAGLSFPSKTFYYLAAGAAVIALAPGTTDLARLVREHQCGCVVTPGDADGLARAIAQLADDRSRLAGLKTAARAAAESTFNRGLTRRFARAIAQTWGRDA